ncbi:S-layer protein [Paenibacillus sp. HJGM_3]|uniref:S-layer protein n=1 Tax=Paenibacillus sp. HJGM_3 TaxID=3379816 RepID=UPI00385AA6EA
MGRRMYKLNVLLILALLLTLLPPIGALAADDAGITSVTDAVYAVSQDGSKQVKVDYVNFNVNSPTQKSNYVALYTSGAGITNNTVYTDKVFVKKFNVAIQVNAQGVTTDVIGPLSLPVSGSTQWEADQYIDIPPGGFVLIASDSSWNTAPKPRQSLFDLRDSALHLERGGVTVTAADFLQPALLLTTQSGMTVTTATYNIEGKVTQYAPNAGLSVTVGGTAATVQADGSFSQAVALTEGLNTIVVKLLKDGAPLQEQSLSIVYEPATGDVIEIEAPPLDITVVVEGPKKRINYIDKDVSGISNIIALFTTEYGPSIEVPQYNVAIQVDATGHVTRMVNPSVNGGTPSWTGPTNLEIPTGGYVVMAQDNSYATYDIKKYLATKFKVGDIAKLRKNGNVVSVSDVMTGLGGNPRLQLDNMPMYTITDTKTTLTGKVSNSTGVSLTVDGQPVALQADGTFSYEKQLTAGPNYIDLVVTKDNVVREKKSVIVYSRPSLGTEKQIILWVDQASNARKLQSSQAVYDFLHKAKEAGVTDVAFDVKGVEGFVSYKKNEFTNRPYVSEMTSPIRSGSNPNLDLLDLFVTHSHTLGMKLHAAFNVFAEGSIAEKDFAVIDQHLDWEEQVFRPEDGGAIKRLRESDYGQRGLAGAANGALVLFVNPANDQVRQYQLKTFEEVLKNYDVDGIILDRGRYDNETADFSDVTKAKFQAFLQARGKQLNNWPADIFTYVGGKRTDGPLIQDWWEFRSGTISSFVKETHDLVDVYEASKQKPIQLSAYVGAWYESYYLNGVHWGSPDFRYDSRLGFPTESIYTPEYYKTGYINYMDFLMVGTYYSTTKDIQRYITLDSIVTNGAVPLYAGMALADLQEPSLQREIFQTAMGSSNGLMLFDASLANWPVVKASIDDVEYVKDYQIGVSNPLNPQSFIEADYYNINRNTGDMNVYNEEFGTSTGTNKFGVEVVADASGKVTTVVNKTQASTWNWSAPDSNNSTIPAGGMVVSAIDDSGIRTKRQLLANTYKAGDDIRSAALSGFTNYDGKTVSTAAPSIQGNVKVMGAGSTVEVKLNGTPATVSQNGDFTGTVALQEGANAVKFTVYVDGKLTNEKTISLTYVRPQLVSLEITGTNGALKVGETAQLKVEAVYDNASRQDVTAQASVQSSNNSVAAVEANALIHAIRAGQVSISASYEGKQATASLTVSTATPEARPDGVTLPATTIESSVVNGQPAVIVTIDADMVRRAVELLKSQGTNGHQLLVEVPGQPVVAQVRIAAQALVEARLVFKDALLTVKSGAAAFQMPADALDTAKLAKKLGVPAADIQFALTLERKIGSELDALNAIVQANGAELVSGAYTVELSAQAGSVTAELDDVGKKDVTFSITVPESLTPKVKAVDFDKKEGRIQNVPAKFVEADGTTTGVIRHAETSTYGIVHWEQ